jgi:Tfp pilus assembly protein PilF
LHSSGGRDAALSLLKETLAKHPDSRDTLEALIGFSREAGDGAAALAYAAQLERLSPAQPR